MRALRHRYGRAAGSIGWVRLAPLASVTTLGGGYLRSEDGRFVIFARRYQTGPTGARQSAIQYRTVEYLEGGSWRTGGPNRELYVGVNLERAKAAVSATLPGPEGP